MKSTSILYLLINILWLLHGCGGGSGSSSFDQNITEPRPLPPTEPDTTIPLFSTADTLTVRENTVVVTSVYAEDDSTVTYSMVGTDSSLFVLDSRLGKLKFKTAPNFESPLDSNQDNTYEITITATDTTENKAELTMHITVTDIDESSSDDSDADYISDNIEILIQSDLGDE